MAVPLPLPWAAEAPQEVGRDQEPRVPLPMRWLVKWASGSPGSGLQVPSPKPPLALGGLGDPCSPASLREEGLSYP